MASNWCSPELLALQYLCQGRHRAEDLNERTMIWSVFVTFAIMCVGFGQVGHSWTWFLCFCFRSLCSMIHSCRCLSWSRSSQRSVPPRCMEPTDILGQKSCDVTKHVTMWHNLSLFWQTVTVVICDEWLLQSSGQFSRENCLHHILLVATHSNRIIADMF